MANKTSKELDFGCTFVFKLTKPSRYNTKMVGRFYVIIPVKDRQDALTRQRNNKRAYSTHRKDEVMDLHSLVPSIVATTSSLRSRRKSLLKAYLFDA